MKEKRFRCETEIVLEVWSCQLGTGIGSVPYNLEMKMSRPILLSYEGVRLTNRLFEIQFHSRLIMVEVRKVPKRRRGRCSVPRATPTPSCSGLTSGDDSSASRSGNEATERLPSGSGFHVAVSFLQ